MKKLAIVTSHPIQYNAPLFQLLAARGKVEIRVFYTWEQSGQGAKYDPDFGKKIEWDIPLLEGYAYTFVKNTAKDPGSHHFGGLVNPTLPKEIASWQADAVLVFGWSFHSHLRCMRHFHGKVPVIFRGDSTLLDEVPGIRRRIRRLLLRWVYSHVDHALYVGTNNKQYFLAHGLKEKELVYAPHAIDNHRFAVPDDVYSRQAADKRLQLGIKEDDLVLLFAGKLEPKKNPFFLLELARRISDPRLKVLIVGNGVLEEELKQAAGADARILFLDFQNQQQMPVIYRMGDIFVLPSRGPGETWGLGANEAMASGCALLLSDKVGGAVDLVDEGRNGLIVGSEDPEKGREWVEGLLADRVLLGRMKTASRHHVLRFSYEAIAWAIENIMTWKQANR
ncbi:glycosyltransferase family 4 protein [Flavitalea sp. BT771]|uniref:glycosyltransferase family 4 protein n=1 Tax=Flavitalea sp. BT771 TaxID=3063329 RepID=UPI0026E1AA09|nr:glycosyltransferase family 4 protein [Flavitalea sp. BT771]MDO6434142.1 glycosyltransferase family 4 protein [Flavitalea sp. BT771]MDV6223042.1 glycosyltransferase family 4 protein [Flavitalea sp. BT771]